MQNAEWMGPLLENRSDHKPLKRGTRHLPRKREENKEWCKFPFPRWDEGMFIDRRGLDFRIRKSSPQS